MLSSFQVSIIVVNVIFPILAGIAVGLRFKARFVKHVSLQADDFLIVLSECIVLGLAGGSIGAALNGGFGVPLQQLNTPAKLITFNKYLFAGNVQYVCAVSFIKISILLFYKRIFVTQKFYRIANVQIAIVAAFFVSFIILICTANYPGWFQYKPVNGHVFNYSAMLIACNVIDIVLDLVTLCLPIPVIRGLQMSTQRKIVLASIFWLGSFCVVAATVRLVYVVQLNQNYIPSTDVYINSLLQLTIWSDIEPCCSIIAACLPTLGPLFREGRSPESLVSSILSKISSRNVSKSRFSTKQQIHSGSNDSRGFDSAEAKQQWQNMQNKMPNINSRPAVSTADVEKGRTPSSFVIDHGISVERSFGAESHSMC